MSAQRNVIKSFVWVTHLIDHDLGRHWNFTNQERSEFILKLTESADLYVRMSSGRTYQAWYHQAMKYLRGDDDHKDEGPNYLFPKVPPPTKQPWQEPLRDVLAIFATVTMLRSGGH